MFPQGIIFSVSTIIPERLDEYRSLKEFSTTQRKTSLEPTILIMPLRVLQNWSGFYRNVKAALL